MTIKKWKKILFSAIFCALISEFVNAGIVKLTVQDNAVLANWQYNKKYVNVKLNIGKKHKISSVDGAITSAGKVIIVWSEHLTNSHDNDIYAQVLSLNGEKLDDNKLAINVFRGNQSKPQVIPTVRGDFFVVWESDSAGKDNQNIWCQKFNSTGQAMWETPIPISAAKGNQISPCVALDVDGSLLVAWEDYRNGEADVYGQRIELDGSLTGPEDGALIDGSPGNQINVSFKFDKNGLPVAIKWSSQRKGFVKPVIVEADISKMPLPEPTLLFSIILFLCFFLRKESKFVKL